MATGHTVQRGFLHFIRENLQLIALWRRRPGNVRILQTSLAAPLQPGHPKEMP
jgi:hypothetical protein